MYVYLSALTSSDEILINSGATSFPRHGKLFGKMTIILASCYCTKLLFAPNINDVTIKCASVVKLSVTDCK